MELNKIMELTAKQKGNRLENIVSKFYRRKLDPDTKRMPRSGALSHARADVLKRFHDGWSDECKYREKMSIYEFWNQAQDQAGTQKPVLFIQAEFKPVLAVIRIEDYFDLREELEDWKKLYDK